jgi:ABC-2 type transport system permease protein
MSDVTAHDANTPTSTIHDLGYRRYTGPRVNASGAWSALYVQSLRAMFGLGRPAKAKVIPILVIVVSMLPALGLLTAASASKGQVPIRYGQLIGAQLVLFVLFLAAQVPEVLSRDQQHRLLPLLFTRDVSRNAYALSRFGAIFTALFLVSLAPLLLLYLGEIGIAKDPAATFKTMGERIGPVLAQSTLTAIAMSGIGAALAAWTPRRAYATAAIFGAFLLLAAVATGLDDLAGVSVRSAELLDPLRALRTMALILFGETNRGMELNPPPSIGVYVSLMLGIGATGIGLLVLRMRRVRT